MSTEPFYLKMEDYCFLDSVFTVFNTHLGRIFLVVLLLFLYKELTMGMYRRVVDMTGKVKNTCLILHL